jgi:Flp pilus assembly protein TadD
VHHLTRDLWIIGARQESLRLLERAQREYPADFTINDELGTGLLKMQPPRLEDAVRFLTAAVALRPENAGARINLGGALLRKGNIDGAIEAFQAAVRISPGYTYAYNNLGAALRKKGDLDGAISAYKEGVRLRPNVAVLRVNLASALDAKGVLEAAEVQARECIRLAPKSWEGYALLGSLLEKSGRFTEALEVLRRGSKDPDVAPDLVKDLRECEHLVELDGKLSKTLRGEAQPAHNAERLELARLCVVHKKLHLAAVRFFREAFAAQPGLADDLNAHHRYNAACAAALVGGGQAKDATGLGAEERARLRRQALDWLRADLGALRRLLEKAPDQARAAVAQRLQHWQQDSDFAGVRGSDALGRLPQAERPDWQQLWADVADTLATAQQKTTPQKKAGTQ